MEKTEEMSNSHYFTKNKIMRYMKKDMTDFKNIVIKKKIRISQEELRENLFASLFKFLAKYFIVLGVNNTRNYQ